MKRSILFLAFCILQSAICNCEDWPQFGGSNRNFKVNVKGLANSWPAAGPKKLWSRQLGEGYSGVSEEGGVLYTMYRTGSKEIAIALDAANGKTLWEYPYEAPIPARNALENGPGPHSTPLIAGDRVFTIGIWDVFNCLDKKTGKLLWSHNLIGEYKAPTEGRGYGSSPLAYKDTVILQVGAKNGAAVMAFRQKDGSVAWKNQDFEVSHSSPILMTVDGQEQLVIFMGDHVVGLDPNNGSLYWSHPHKTDWNLNISTPVSEGNLLFCSSAYSGGSRALELSRAGGKTNVKELWFTNRMRIHTGNAIMTGGNVYGSSGDFGPAFLIAMHVADGKELWRDRNFPKANFVYADGKLIILDEDGRLTLARPGPSGLQVLAFAQVLRRNVWTAPTLVGTNLYIRDRSSIMALDLK
jgi:outer membrane protein assembly factor BamB